METSNSGSSGLAEGRTNKDISSPSTATPDLALSAALELEVLHPCNKNATTKIRQRTNAVFVTDEFFVNTMARYFQNSTSHMLCRKHQNFERHVTNSAAFRLPLRHEMGERA